MLIFSCKYILKLPIIQNPIKYSWRNWWIKVYQNYFCTCLIVHYEVTLKFAKSALKLILVYWCIYLHITCDIIISDICQEMWFHTPIQNRSFGKPLCTTNANKESVPVAFPILCCFVYHFIKCAFAIQANQCFWILIKIRNVNLNDVLDVELN